MKTIAFTFAALLLATPAVAADLVEEAPAPIVAETPIYDWTGGYLGIYKGGTWVNGDFRVPGDRVHEDFNGFTLGKFVGYNFMYGNILIGIEGDITYSWNENHYRAFGQRNDVGTDWGGSARARVGYAFDRALVFATGGWAATRANIDTPTGNADRTFHGWNVGAGIDWAFRDDIFIRAEYRFSDFGNKNINGVKVNLDQHQALIGIAYKF